MTAALDTYAELRLAEGKLLRWGERAAKAACALQARDLEILVALARYRFLTAGQIAGLWWQGRSLRAVRRRMTRLFEAGFVERFGRRRCAASGSRLDPATLGSRGCRSACSLRPVPLWTSDPSGTRARPADARNLRCRLC